MTFKKLTQEEKLTNKEKRKQEKWDREHKIIDGVIHKWCNYKNHWVQMNNDNFYKNDKNSIDGYSTKCIPCDIERAKANAKANPERVKIGWKKQNDNASLERILYKRAQARKSRENGFEIIWRKQHPERCNELSSQHRIHDITTAEWNACLKEFGYKCAYCGMTLEEHLKEIKQTLHKEHVDHTGYNDLRNAVPACRSCNVSKWQFVMEEWYEQQPFYSESKYNFIMWWLTEGYTYYIEDKPNYRLLKKQNEDKKTFHFELWTVDEKRNTIECVGIGNKKNDLKALAETL